MIEGARAQKRKRFAAIWDGSCFVATMIWKSCGAKEKNSRGEGKKQSKNEYRTRYNLKLRYSIRVVVEGRKRRDSAVERVCHVADVRRTKNSCHRKRRKRKCRVFLFPEISCLGASVSQAPRDDYKLPRLLK